MAIAYFIPDQAKLLAGQRPSSGSNNSSSRSASTNQPSPRLQQNNSAQETAPVNGNANRGYGTTINISVPTFNNTTQEPLGCWDFLTQVFCHALRFYHESSQLQPTVIQISVNFNTTATTTDAAAPTSSSETTATTNLQQVPTAETTSATATTGDRKQKKLSKRKN